MYRANPQSINGVVGDGHGHDGRPRFVTASCTAVSFGEGDCVAGAGRDRYAIGVSLGEVEIHVLSRASD